MWEAVQLVVAVLFLTFAGLSWAANRYPDVAWLQRFRWPELPVKVRERQRRRAERIAGVEFILLGVTLPIGYVILTVMTFGSLDPWWMIGVGLASIACIAAGITAIVKNWR